MKLSLIGKTARITAAVLACAAAWSAYAACPSIPTAQRFEINGAEVKDKTTGLIWQRCLAGDTWSGMSCKGQATKMTHEEALKYAEKQSPWRLPDVKELSSLIDRGCSNRVAIDRDVFPTGTHFYWSSSPYAGNPAYAWAVYFGSGFGYAFYYLRLNDGEVRLVRTAP